MPLALCILNAQRRIFRACQEMDVPISNDVTDIVCPVLRCSIFKRQRVGVRFGVWRIMGVYKFNHLPCCTYKKLQESRCLSVVQ
ncbi:hypothetical protein SAMN05216562_2536 [Microbulbifer marinus]|uniref:Uncharacterized protein n=1 Tax=Microbulbifer marinus TaxID=658218 RepID=A0A1H4A521_9GAMM|nr:hypothetical protein SAMN05216562_2536 [Microbulbifer marinus]